MLLHKCRRCGYQSHIFEKWVNHLWEQQHQTVSRSSFLKWSDQENLRSLVIYAPAPPYPLPSEVLELFLDLDIMTVDFVCWTERPQNFVIQFGQREDVERVMKIMREQPNQLTFRDNTLGLRRKSDVADFEWPGLIGAGTARDGSSENPVLIELSDDSNSNNSHEDPPVEATASDSGNGSTGSENMDTDDVPQETVNGESENAAVESMGEDVQLESEISNEFRTLFLEKITKKSKDDKRKVIEHLKQMQTLWLDMYLGFQNKLWPLCFVMTNKGLTINSNEVGFEAKFTCECLKSKVNDWFIQDKKGKLEEKIEEFLKIITDDNASSQRAAKIAAAKKSKILRFKCHIIVTFYDDGSTKAKLKFESIKGINPDKKMKIIQKVYKRLFLQHEAHQIKQWSPKVKKEVQKDKIENDNWAEIEVIKVE